MKIAFSASVLGVCALESLLCVCFAGCAAAPKEKPLSGAQAFAGATSPGAIAAVGGSAAPAMTASMGAAGVPGAAASGPAAGSGSAATRVPTGAVAKHGALHTKGNRIVNAAGEPVQLRGLSLFWTQWTGYYKPNTVDQLVDDWRASLVRAALGIESKGYLESPTDNEAKVVAVVDRAIERGAYVIIDWHDHHASDNQAAATDFFTRMAKKYGSTPNVIFEIWNEPLKVDWQSVKTYATNVITAIRTAGGKNLVIVGTPNWSQDVDVAAQSPITGQEDVAYTLHFYAGTHKQYLRDKAKQALDSGLPLFVTEWGTCEASGNGMVDQAETMTWMSFLDEHHISWANWSLNDKAESCSALTPTAGTSGPWAGNALTASGSLVKSLLP